jgi:PAS domain S-box-containing protein
MLFRREGRMTVQRINKTHQVHGARSVARGPAEKGYDGKELSAGEWETLFDSITDMVSIHDRDFRIIKANKAFIEKMGIPTRDLIGRRCHDVIHHMEAPWASCPHRQAMETRTAVTEEFLEPRLKRYLQVSSSPILDKWGEIAGSVHIIKDVTDRKQGEKALRKAHGELERRVEERTRELNESLNELERQREELETRNTTLMRYQEELEDSRELYSDLYDYAPVGYLTFRQDGAIVRANLGAAGLLGVTRDRLINRPLKSFVAPGYMDAFRSHIREVFADGGRRRCELGLKRKDGEVFYVACESVPAKDNDGNLTRLRSALSDITDRRIAEERLRESEERFRLLFEGHHAAMLLIEPLTGAIIDANEAAAQFYGYSRAVLASMKIQEINRMGAEEIAAELLRAAGQQRNYFIFPHRLAGGEVRTVEIHSSPIEVQGRRVLFSIIHDITERKKAEEKLKESELALRISQRDLRKLAGRLLTAGEEERRRVARELHDDFTQRLAVLAIDAGKLEQGLAVKCPEAVPAIERLKEQVVQLSGDVHRLARQLHPSILDDLGLVKAIESECTRFSKQEDIVVKLASNILEPIVKEVAIALYRIVQEALRNTAKHAHAKEARVTLTSTPDALRLTVADNGKGFDPKPVKGKAGMGLASMRERVRLLRGKFSVESLPGEGTLITVEIPLKRRNP